MLGHTAPATHERQETTMARTTEQWVEFLATRFAGTEYEARRPDYYGWVSAGVSADDDPEDVAAAWKDQRQVNIQV
jgi:hypothetical protein